MNSTDNLRAGPVVLVRHHHGHPVMLLSMGSEVQPVWSNPTKEPLQDSGDVELHVTADAAAHTVLLRLFLRNKEEFHLVSLLLLLLQIFDFTVSSVFPSALFLPVTLEHTSLFMYMQFYLLSSCFVPKYLRII